MNIKEELDNIINTINSHKDWSKLEKTRYAYIELGKKVHKDTMFFYTIQNNLLNDGKSELQYDIDKIDKIMNTENLFDYQVICKTSAEMLKYILDNCNIENEIRKTTKSNTYIKEDKKVDIKHYFLIFTDDENKKYFVALNPDLPNIQIGSNTSNFGNDIEYLDRTNNDEHYYEGDEIKHTILTNEQIKELDRKIGFDFNIVYNDKTNTYSEEYTNYFFELLRKSYISGEDYLNSLSKTTNEYFNLVKILNGNIKCDQIKEYSEEEKEDISLNFSIKNNNFDEAKKYLILPITNLYKKYNLKSINIEECINDKKYKTIFDDFRMQLFLENNPKKINNLGIINPLKRMKEIIRLFETMDKISNMDINDENFLKTKRFLKQSIEEVSLQFVDEKYLPIDRENLPNTYISKKINLSFKQIFDIGNKTKFNELGLSEQIPIVKEVLEIILQDIKPNRNIFMYDENKSAVMNRIFSTILFDKITKKPYYLFYIKTNNISKTELSGNIPIMFDMTENKLITNVSLTDILSKYYVIKDVDLKLIIEEIAKKGITK